MAIGVPPRFGVPHLSPASVVKRAGWQDSEELRVSNWLAPWDGEEPLDAGLIGLPYSGASINPSGAYGAPESVRLAFRYNTTYSPDWDTDIRGLRARDLGDVGGHLTDVDRGPRQDRGRRGGRLRHRAALRAGDDRRRSLRHRAGRARLLRGEPGQARRHHQHRRPPRRAQLRARTAQRHAVPRHPHRRISPIEGRNVVELGIHGFMNAANYMQWAREQGVDGDQRPRRAAAGDGGLHRRGAARSPATGPTSSTSASISTAWPFPGRSAPRPPRRRG